MLGSGAIMVMDEMTDIPEAATLLLLRPASRAASAHRAARAAPGWADHPQVIEGRGTDGDLDRLFAVGETICPRAMPHAASEERLGLEATPFPYRMTTICFLGPSAYVPMHSAVTLFREEFEAKIKPA